MHTSLLQLSLHYFLAEAVTKCDVCQLFENISILNRCFIELFGRLVEFFFWGWLSCALIEEQHFPRAERLRLTQKPRWDGCTDLLLIFILWRKRTSTRCLTGNVSGRFKLISISSSDDFIQAGVEERAQCRQRDSSPWTVTQKPAADL